MECVRAALVDKLTYTSVSRIVGLAAAVVVVGVSVTALAGHAGEHSDGDSDLEEFCDLDEGERAGRNITGRRRRRPAGYASSRERARPR